MWADEFLCVCCVDGHRQREKKRSSVACLHASVTKLEGQVFSYTDEEGSDLESETD